MPEIWTTPAPAGPEYYYDEAAAMKAVNFFENVLLHVKGEWAGQPFMLQEWQREEIIKPIFGWKRKEDETRKYRTVYIEVPRKNGKSTLAAGIALYLLFADGEFGAEVYSAAADREQAAIVHTLARQMVETAPVLMSEAEVYKRSIIIPGTMGTYRVLSADAFTKHGLNASGVVVDELHVQPNRNLVDVLVTSVGARRQPLVVLITTAGFNKESVCYEYHEYGVKVSKGIIEDPAFFLYILAAAAEDDWLDLKTWEAVNPGLGNTVKLEYLQGEARKAANVPAYQNTFKRLHLNLWTSQETRWLDTTAWDLCGDPINPKILEGAKCWGGLDLASTVDLAAFVLCFGPEDGEPEHYAWLPFFWIPEENIIERARRDRVPYDAWARDGLINTTEGNTIDYGFIIKAIEDLGEIYNISEIAFDRWGAFQISQQLVNAGFELVGFGQGFVSMSAPTKELLRLVLDKKLQHGGHPVLRWMADNMMVSTDPAGNVKPNKQKSREKIDGMVAGIMALDRATRHLKIDSVYDERGIREV